MRGEQALSLDHSVVNLKPFPAAAARLLQSIWLPVLLVFLWQIASQKGWIHPLFFPPPTRVFATAWDMARTGELAAVVWATLGRYMIGSVIGVAAGIACGAWMGFSTPVRRAIEPLVAALYATPKLTLLPLFMLVLGVGNGSKLTLIALVGFIFLATQTMDAIRSINPSYPEMARNYGASPGALLRRVYLPAALPQVFTGMRMALTRSLVLALSLELVSGPDGIGTLIWASWQTLATDRLYVGILLSSLLGIVLHQGLSALEARLVPWNTRAAER